MSQGHSWQPEPASWPPNAVIRGPRWSYSVGFRKALCKVNKIWENTARPWHCWMLRNTPSSRNALRPYSLTVRHEHPPALLVESSVSRPKDCRPPRQEDAMLLSQHAGNQWTYFHWERDMRERVWRKGAGASWSRARNKDGGSRKLLGADPRRHRTETGTRRKPVARLSHGCLMPWAALGARREVAHRGGVGLGIEIAPPVSHWVRAARRGSWMPWHSLPALRLPSSTEVKEGPACMTLVRPLRRGSWHRPPGRGARPEGVLLKFIKSRRVNGDKTNYRGQQTFSVTCMKSKHFRFCGLWGLCHS